MSDKPLVFDDFADKVGQVFTISFADTDAFALTLAEAELLKTRQLPPSGRPPFSLVFLGDGERFLEQRLYWLEHRDMGQIELFLVPIGKDARGFQYQALFN